MVGAREGAGGRDIDRYLTGCGASVGAGGPGGTTAALYAEYACDLVPHCSLQVSTRSCSFQACRISCGSACQHDTLQNRDRPGSEIISLLVLGIYKRQTFFGEKVVLVREKMVFKSAI